MTAPRLTKAERKAIAALAEAWNQFNSLARQHDDDTAEFRHHLHACQRIVMSRPAFRDLQNWKSPKR